MEIGFTKGVLCYVHFNERVENPVKWIDLKR